MKTTSTTMTRLSRALAASLLAASASAQVSYGSGVNGSLCGDTGIGFVSFAVPRLTAIRRAHAGPSRAPGCRRRLGAPSTRTTLLLLIRRRWTPRQRATRRARGRGRQEVTAQAQVL